MKKLLVVDQSSLAEKRTTLAVNRSLLAVERTFAAWIRTGFAIAGAGITLSAALSGTTSRNISLLMGSILLVLGMFTFVYAWIEYRSSYNFVREVYKESNEPIQSFRFNFLAGTILIIVLLIVSLLGFIMILF